MRSCRCRVTYPISTLTYPHRRSFTPPCLALLLVLCTDCCSRRFEIVPSRRVIHPPPVSTSTLRATKKKCHSDVQPVPTGRPNLSASVPLFRVLAPPAVGEGSKDSPKQEDRKNESRTSKTDRKQHNRATPAGSRSRPQRAAQGIPRGDGAFPALFVGQRNAHRITETECHARRRLSRMAQTGPLREEGRERHSDSRPDR